MRIITALGVGVVAFIVTLVVGNGAANTAEVVMVLDQDEVDWPYHDAVRQDAAGALETDPDALAVARAAGDDSVTLNTELYSGQSHFRLEAVADDTDTAVAAANAAADWAAEQSLVERRAVIDERIVVLETNLAEVEDRLVSMEGDVARFDELSRRAGQIEAQLDAERTERELLRSQIRPAGEAEPAGSSTGPWLALLAGAGAALAAFYILDR